MKTFVTKEQIESANKKALKKAKKWGHETPKGGWLLPVKYFTRLNMFKTSTGNLTFDPVSGDGYSYNWYKICGKRGRKFFLNTYHYSMQTGRHKNDLHRLFDLLGVSYETVEAPRGLTDDSAIKNHSLFKFGEAVVANKHSRKPVKNAGSYWIANAAKVGIKLSKEDKEEAIAGAEAGRRKRLDRQAAEKRENLVKTEIKRLILESGGKLTRNDVSPNFVADVASRLNVKLTSEEVVYISNRI